MKVYANAPPSMRAVFESTGAFADREFLVYDDERWTYADLHVRVRALAHLLHERGIRKGDRVAIGMRNYPEWVLAFWACQSIGAVAVTLNAWWTGDELNYAFEDSGARAAILDGERVERIAPYLAKLPLEVVLGVRDAVGSPHAESLDDALKNYLDRDRAAGCRHRPRRLLDDHVHVRHHRPSEGCARDASQSRHQPDQLVSRRCGLGAARGCDAAGEPAASGVAADVSVLPHRRLERPVRQ